MFKINIIYSLKYIEWLTIFRGCTCVQDIQNLFRILYYVSHTFKKTALTRFNLECPHAPNVNLKRELDHGLYFSS
jgi:hypothetical protein